MIYSAARRHIWHITRPQKQTTTTTTTAGAAASVGVDFVSIDSQEDDEIRIKIIHPREGADLRAVTFREPYAVLIPIAET